MWVQDESGSTTFNNTWIVPSQENLSLTCAARHIQDHKELPYSMTFTTTVRALQAIAYFMMFLIALSLNIAVIVLAAKFKRLQTHSFGIALQIAALNILVSVLYLIGFVNCIAHHWVLGEHVCVITGTLLLNYGNIRTLLMFVFVLNRFLFVFLPFAYPKYHRKALTALSILVWLLPIMTSILPMPHILDCYSLHRVSLLCTSLSVCGKDCMVFSNTNYTLVVIPGAIVPTILYIILCIKAWNLKKATVPIEANSSKGDWKATITFFILFVTVFVTTVPTITVNVIISRLTSPL